MSDNSNLLLTVGGILSAIAALLHVGIIIGGPAWYRFFGAGEAMATMAERGEIRPTVITLAIAAVLFSWALYAFSGAGLIMRLPLLNYGLAAISAVYLLRGLALVPIYFFRPDIMNAFWVWSSLICLGYGVVHAVGTWRAWPHL